MSSAEKQTADAMLASASLLALVPQENIYPDEIEEKWDVSNGPAICYERGDSTPNYTLNGTLHSSRVTIIVTCWAKSRSLANAVALKVSEAMAAVQNEQVSQGSGYEPDLEEYAAIVAFDVWELD